MVTSNHAGQPHTTTLSAFPSCCDSSAELGSGLSGAALQYHFQVTLSALSAALESDTGKNPGGNQAK